MQQEQFVLNSFANNRDLYTRLNSIIDEEDFSIQGTLIYNEIVHYYDSDVSAEGINKEILKSKLQRKYPKNSETLTSIIDKFDEDISTTNAGEEIIEYKKGVIGVKLGALLLNPTSSAKDRKRAMEEYAELSSLRINDLDEEKEKVFIGPDIAELAVRQSPGNLYKIFPSSLNEILGGGVPLHTHIGLMGVPESGKTLFAINNASGFARGGHKVLYVGNEDPEDQYLMRLSNRITGRTREEIIADPHGSDKLARERGWENIIFAPLAPGTFSEIRCLIEEHEPLLVIIDQIRQIEIPGIDGDVAQLTEATRAARKMTKQYPIITMSFTQAGDSAENKLILGKGDVYMSNTTFPGDVDVLIGWGMNDSYEQSGRRMISLPKNKLSGRHEHIQVSIDPHTSKVIS